MELPKSLQEKLNQRKENNTLRSLAITSNLIDFSSNDYLGFAKDEELFNNTHHYLLQRNLKINGATGSRLLSGNHILYEETEKFIAQFHQSETALLFNSGYDANIGFFSSVPQRNDIILYDEFCHASIRDGILLSNAKHYKFRHNDLANLEKNLRKYSSLVATIYIVTESVFSMDGDSPDLKQLVNISKKYGAYCIIDEAHAAGVLGNNGNGLVELLNLQNEFFARIITFGKAFGCHGAAILCNQNLKKYLVNFTRSLIYTTGLSPHSVATILNSYYYLINNEYFITKLKDNIDFFTQEIARLNLNNNFIISNSAIQCAVILGNEKVKSIALQLQQNGFDVKPILYPTVPKGKERLRFCLHSYNSFEDISNVLAQLKMLL